MLSRELLEILACPVCKTPLAMAGTDKLKCAKCGRVYPVRDGIPILLVEEASLDNS